MTISVLILAEFDPVSVCALHRDAIRGYAAAHGLSRAIDIRLAVATAYTPEHRDADWVGSYATGTAKVVGGDPIMDFVTNHTDPAMVDFAESADIIQVCPAIGQPWASYPDTPPGSLNDTPHATYFNVQWDRILRGKKHKVAYFHGSRTTWAYRDAYARFFRDAGYVLATSTLDYATLMPAAYLPPPVSPRPEMAGRAPLRADDDPLIVSHTPSDPSNCSTAEFLAMCSRLGIVARYKTMRPFHEVMTAKRESHAYFDHLRGSYSVNTLEGMAVGCVPLVGLTPACRDFLATEGMGAFPGPEIVTASDLGRALAGLSASPEGTRAYQERAHRWVHEQYASDKIAQRLIKFYQGVLDR